MAEMTAALAGYSGGSRYVVVGLVFNHDEHVDQLLQRETADKVQDTIM